MVRLDLRGPPGPTVSFLCEFGIVKGWEGLRKDFGNYTASDTVLQFTSNYEEYLFNQLAKYSHWVKFPAVYIFPQAAFLVVSQTLPSFIPLIFKLSNWPDEKKNMWINMKGYFIVKHLVVCFYIGAFWWQRRHRTPGPQGLQVRIC